MNHGAQMRDVMRAAGGVDGVDHALLAEFCDIAGGGTTEKWLTYDGPSGELYQDGKRALDAARAAGVFTVGWFAAQRPPR